MENVNTEMEKPLMLNSDPYKYTWACRFSHANYKLDCYTKVNNNCETFKQLRRAWRLENPHLKLLAGIIVDKKQMV